MKPGEILVTHGNTHRGYEYPLIKFVIISESDIFGKEKKKKEVDEAVELVFQDMENRMKTVMGTKVNISRKDKTKGKIELEYYSEAELERIVELIESITPM